MRVVVDRDGLDLDRTRGTAPTALEQRCESSDV
jgi:hypothetical protein